MNIESWTENFFASPIIEMPKDVAEMFVNFSLLERNDVDKKSALWKSDSDSVETPVSLRMMMKHSAARQLDITLPAMAFLALGGVIQTPGQISMYCVALRQKQLKTNKCFDMENLAYTFPFRFSN